MFEFNFKIKLLIFNLKKEKKASFADLQSFVETINFSSKKEKQNLWFTGIKFCVSQSCEPDKENSFSV